jgi:hypothetical protein
MLNIIKQGFRKGTFQNNVKDIMGAVDLKKRNSGHHYSFGHGVWGREHTNPTLLGQC